MNATASVIPSGRGTQVLIGVLTIAFLGMSIWNIYQQHRYRQLEYELHKKMAGQ